jgi:hypothetical protein
MKREQAKQLVKAALIVGPDGETVVTLIVDKRGDAYYEGAPGIAPERPISPQDLRNLLGYVQDLNKLVAKIKK